MLKIFVSNNYKFFDNYKIFDKNTILFKINNIKIQIITCIFYIFEKKNYG